MVTMETGITTLLDRVRDGDREALDELIPIVYEHLHRIAEGHLRTERAGHTVQATSLVSEAYLRLAGMDHPDYRNRAHFFGIASRLMRQILIDHARAKGSEKRGGDQLRVDLPDLPAGDRPPVILALDDALNRLAQTDPDKARFVEMRFFAGMTVEEIAEASAVSVVTVRRHLRIAQACLYREIATA